MTLTRPQQTTAERLLELVGPLRLRHCPLIPTPRQEAFLRLRGLEVLYGGAAGGGKSVALLMAALQYADVPGYHALLLRPTLVEFELPGGLVELAHEWLNTSKAVWSGDTKTWRFPGLGKTGAGGASLRFGYLDNDKDVTRYAGSSFSFVGYDELVRFDQAPYRRLFRVLRQADAGVGLRAAPDGATLADVPVRARATSNPGGPGHAWVKAYFVDPASRQPGVRFLPASLHDNPHLNQADYCHSLALLPPSERERLLSGDWEIPDEGELFQREWFEIIEPDQVPARTRAVRFWDLAATEPSPTRPDPDFTVGLRLELDDTTGIYYITEISRVRKAPGAVERLVAETARRDGKAVQIIIEEEPGAAGRHLTSRFKSHLLRGYNTRSERPTGPKLVRARVAAAAAENGLIKIVRGPNSNDLLDELSSFPHGAHDDCVDALAGARNALDTRRQTHISLARGTIWDLTQKAHGRRQARANELSRANARTRQDEADAQLAALIGIAITSNACSASTSTATTARGRIAPSNSGCPNQTRDERDLP